VTSNKKQGVQQRKSINNSEFKSSKKMVEIKHERSKHKKNHSIGRKRTCWKNGKLNQEIANSTRINQATERKLMHDIKAAK
jgi:hypothetical protein